MIIPYSLRRVPIALRGSHTEKQKERFNLCGKRRNELLSVCEKEAFIRGFKLGARMAAEVLSDG